MHPALEKIISKKGSRTFKPLNIFERVVLKEFFLFIQMNCRVFCKMANHISFKAIETYIKTSIHQI